MRESAISPEDDELGAALALHQFNCALGADAGAIGAGERMPRRAGAAFVGGRAGYALTDAARCGATTRSNEAAVRSTTSGHEASQMP